jgi:hypothetical protein
VTWDLDFSQKPRNAFVDIFIFDFMMARCTSRISGDEDLGLLHTHNFPETNPDRSRFVKIWGRWLSRPGMVPEAISESSCERDVGEP